MWGPMVRIFGYGEALIFGLPKAPEAIILGRDFPEQKEWSRGRVPLEENTRVLKPLILGPRAPFFKIGGFLKPLLNRGCIEPSGS